MFALYFFIEKCLMSAFKFSFNNEETIIEQSTVILIKKGILNGKLSKKYLKLCLLTPFLKKYKLEKNQGKKRTL